MATVVAEFVFQIFDDGTVNATSVNVELAAHQAAVQTVQQAKPGSQVVQDPWANTPGTQATAQQPAAQTQQQVQGNWQQPQPTYAQPPVQAPVCVHGPLRAVPGGVAGPNSRNPGKPYGAFWACQAPQGVAKCRLDKNSLPPVPA